MLPQKIERAINGHLYGGFAAPIEHADLGETQSSRKTQTQKFLLIFVELSQEARQSLQVLDPFQSPRPNWVPVKADHPVVQQYVGG